MDICRFCTVLSKILCSHVKNEYFVYIKQMCTRQNEWPAEKRGHDGCDKAFLLHRLLPSETNPVQPRCKQWRKCLRTRRTHLIPKPPHLAHSFLHNPSQIWNAPFWRMIPSCSRTLLDSAFENEAKCKSETEAAKREVLRLSDKFEQVWIFASNCFSFPTWTPSLANYCSFNKRVRGGGG